LAISKTHITFDQLAPKSMLLEVSVLYKYSVRTSQRKQYDGQAVNDI